MTESDDATVVRPRPAEAGEADDATVVRPRGTATEAETTESGGEDAEAGDATVVRPSAVAEAGADASTEAGAEVEDATVVRPRPRPRPRPRDAGEDDAAAETAERTVVRPARAAGPSTASTSSSSSGTVAPPVEEPEVSGRGFDASSGAGLDPERRIAGVPGRAPWEVAPLAERGVRPGAPVVYGARSERLGEPSAGIDEVHRRLGDPPPATLVPVREGREALPSMARRAGRARVGTLIGYAAAVVVAVLGLWGVAVLAFS